MDMTERYSRGRPLSQVEVEEKILEHLDLLEEGHEAYVEAATDYAEKEWQYTSARHAAKARWLAGNQGRSPRPTDWEARIVVDGYPEIQELDHVARLAEVVEKSARDAQFKRRAQLDGLRTIAANQRQLVS
jgi:hypothetical protein